MLYTVSLDQMHNENEGHDTGDFYAVLSYHCTLFKNIKHGFNIVHYISYSYSFGSLMSPFIHEKWSWTPYTMKIEKNSFRMSWKEIAVGKKIIMGLGTICKSFFLESWMASK